MATLTPEAGETTVVFESDGTNRSFVAVGGFDCASLEGLIGGFRLSATPRNLRLDRAGDDRLTVSWDAPPNYPASGYDLQYRLAPDTDSCRITVASSVFCPGAMQVAYDSASPGSGVEITGLAPDTGYQVSVRARDAFPLDVGHFSSWAGPLSAMTRPENSDPTGQPVIRLDGQPIGQTAPRVDDTLSVDVTGISDADGLSNVSYAYRWLRAGTEIAMATGATYMVRVDDVGSALSVRVSFTDDGDNEEALASATTAAVAAAPPVVTMEAGPDVVEGETAVFTLRRSGTTTAPRLDVNVSVSEDGDVVAPANEGPTTVAFGVGAATTTLSVATMDDTQAREHSTVTVAFTPGVGYEIGEPASAAVLVRDNDEAPAAVVTMEAGPDVVEGDTAVFTLRRSGTTTARLDVNVSVSEDGDVVAPANEGPTTVAFGVGAATTTLSVATMDDTQAREHSTVTVAFTPGVGYEIGEPASAAVPVRDNDEAAVVTMEAGPDVVEGDTAVFTLRRSGTTTARLDVNVSVSEDGDVVAPANEGPTTVAFGVGAATTTLSVATMDDTQAREHSAVTVAFTPGVGYEIGEPASAAVLVRDNDEAVVTMEAGPDVVEGDTAVFTLRRSGTTTARLAVNVSVSEDGDVVAPANEGPTTVAFGVGAATTTLLVATMDDTQDEERSTVTVALTLGAGYEIGEPASAAVPVRDNDEAPPAAPPVVTMEAGPDVVEGDTAVFTLRRSGTTTARLDVNVRVSEDGDVVAPANEGPTTVAFGVGAATTTLSVATMDDTQAREPSTVTVAFTPGVGYVIGEPASAAVPVRDNDEAPAALAGVAEGWLSRFGRTVSGHVSDAVRLRLRGEGKDSRVELAGRRLGPAAAGEGPGGWRAQGGQGGRNGWGTGPRTTLRPRPCARCCSGARSESGSGTAGRRAARAGRAGGGRARPASTARRTGSPSTGRRPPSPSGWTRPGRAGSPGSRSRAAPAKASSATGRRAANGAARARWRAGSPASIPTRGSR